MFSLFQFSFQSKIKKTTSLSDEKALQAFSSQKKLVPSFSIQKHFIHFSFIGKSSFQRPEYKISLAIYECMIRTFHSQTYKVANKMRA
jgi:hypothetical protein